MPPAGWEAHNLAARRDDAVGANLSEENGTVKATIEVDCTPEEARAFLGLPDVTALNDHLIREMKARLEANLALLAPEDLMRNWMSLGGQASEHFLRLMTGAAGGGSGRAT